MISRLVTSSSLKGEAASTLSTPRVRSPTRMGTASSAVIQGAPGMGI